MKNKINQKSNFEEIKYIIHKGLYSLTESIIVIYLSNSNKNQDTTQIIINYQSILKEIKKRQSKIRMGLYSFIGIAILSYFVNPNDNLGTAQLIFLLFIVPSLLIYGINYINRTELQIIKNAETVMYLHCEIYRNRGFDTLRYRAVEDYYKNTILKYNKSYHNETKHSSFGYSYLSVENDLERILENVIDNEINIAKKNYEYFNNEYIVYVLSKISQNKNYVNIALELNENEYNKWDRSFETLAKGQGISKQDLYDEMEQKEKLFKIKKDLLDIENEKIIEQNRQNSYFVITTGTCPFCKNKISMSATKCPVCTGDIIIQGKKLI